MHNLKDLRNNLESFKKKLKERNVEFDIDNFNRKDKDNRDLIIEKEKLEQEKKSLSKSKDQANFIKSKKFQRIFQFLQKNRRIVRSI
jgi:seryl-tRNA synthetase